MVEAVCGAAVVVALNGDSNCEAVDEFSKNEAVENVAAAEVSDLGIINEALG